MKTSDALNHFGGSRRKLAEKLGISYMAVYLWGEKVPELRAYQIECLTGGDLKANSADTVAEKCV